MHPQTDRAKPTPKIGKTSKLAAGAKIALDALTEALAASGRIPPSSNHIPANTHTVSLSLWRRHFYQRNPESNPEARKKSFQNSRKSLQARGMVGIWGTETCNEEEVQCWIVI